MGSDVDRTHSDDSAADSQKSQDDEEGKEHSKKLRASAELVVSPLDIFGSWNFVVFDQKLFSIEQVLLDRLLDAAATDRPHTVVPTGVEEIVIVEVCQTVDL